MKYSPPLFEIQIKLWRIWLNQVKFGGLWLVNIVHTVEGRRMLRSRKKSFCGSISMIPERIRKLASILFSMHCCGADPASDLLKEWIVFGTASHHSGSLSRVEEMHCLTPSLLLFFVHFTLSAPKGEGLYCFCSVIMNVKSTRITCRNNWSGILPKNRCFFWSVSNASSV